MGSPKKHKHEKHESKKKKHRSRSRSQERPKERHKHHKRHHHKEKKREKKDKNGEIISKYEELDSEDDIAAPPPPKISRPITPPPPSISSGGGGSSGAGGGGGGGGDSLSIEETNRLRIKLGLKPLKVNDVPTTITSEDAEKRKERELSGATMGGKDMGEFVHRPADNLATKSQSEKLKQRLQERREKRKLESRLSTVKPLGESDSEDDAVAWVEKTRKLHVEREQAAKRAKMLEELDAEFGVGELVESEIQTERKDAYSSRDLRGLKVQHAVDRFSEKTVILTLKDSQVLDEGDDVLVNVNMIDEERYEKNVSNKKLKPGLFGYNVYEDDNNVDEFGNYRKKEILSKYDDEIQGETRKSFALGDDVAAIREHRAREAIKDRLSKKRIESLSTPALQLASDYYTPDELDVKFKKPKKKVRKIRRKALRADDLLPDGDGTSDLASRPGRSEPSSGELVLGPDGVMIQVKTEPPDETPLDVDDTPEVSEDFSQLKMEPDEGELELHMALKKARKLKQLEEVKPSVETVARSILEHSSEARQAEAGSIVLNATAEFCRTLGDIPTYGLSGNRDENEHELMDFDKETRPAAKKRLGVVEDDGRGAWNEVEIDEKPVDVLPTEVPILDVEPDVGEGVAGALRVALSKGYLERENMNKPSASRFAHLQAQNYSIEDKTHYDDDKFGRRERYSGPTSDFKEKDTYKPNVKLDYIDDEGHVLNAKEAFRYLSHKFHGKGPGKNKVEKRMKKNEQEGLMKQMSSTDTPLGTLNLLQQKQRETQSAFVVLSGSKQATSISKTKL